MERSFLHSLSMSEQMRSSIAFFKSLLTVAALDIGRLNKDDGNVNENIEKQWIKLQNTITASGNATTCPLFLRRLFSCFVENVNVRVQIVSIFMQL